MKEWLTAREIAAERLPYLPNDERNIQRLAARESWNEHPSFVRPRKAVGGGMEYHYRILPTLAQVAYVQRHMTIGEAASVADEAANDAAPSLTARASEERDARLAIIAAFDAFSAGLRATLMTRQQIFCDKYAMGSIKVEPWVKTLVPSLSKRSLSRWIAAKRQGKLDALAVDRGQARKGTGILDTANDGRVRAWMLALVAQQPFLSAKRVRDLCRHEFGDEIETAKGRVAMPPVRTFQHCLKGLKAENKVLLTKITNPDKYRSIMAPAGVGTLRHVSEPNQLWQIDASPVDALCVDGRHSLYACIDIATRRLVITVSKTPRASAVMLMIRKAVLAWGVPETIKTDNGSDFVARDTKRLLTSLGIEIDLSDAYSPQQKAHVERVIKTFQHDCGPLLPGFVGHSVEDRKAIESRKSFAARLGESEKETFGVTLTAAELQRHIDDWVELSYHQAPHAGLGRKTPAQVAMAAMATVRRVDARALDTLLMPVKGDGLRTVTKLGVRIDGYHYQSGRLLPGDQVFVRHDPLDMGKAYAFSADGAQFLAEIECAELSGIHPETFQKAVREQRSETLERLDKAVRRDMREMAKGPSMIEKVLEVARRDQPNVVALPKRSSEHSTPQIAAAIDAQTRHPKSSEASADVKAEQQRLASELDPYDDNGAYERISAKVAARVEEHRDARRSAFDGNVVAMPETALDRYRRAVIFRRAMEANEPVDDRDLIWLGQYETTAEFQGQQVIHDDYGDEWLGL
ncbi:DDE-type integrase/transposase/recombinase [Pelagibacterium halotolerans]|uniref:Transposase-like protein n=1 Tax=Pelagibacterium halotolerans (strain DSM 22347 / JCM 15775 / CGMCC 1.7692 / B2) TaxID=1082931 RepID=G4RDZ0_PELHB|nr:DDE-type integrase/transposase/recombinase [Pelagibacterium halotolerans]AEQ50784.1 transposase-like protein [Pelagibacterium halotolerans B2]QJR19299.1 DDE-type integrase/transposase/recombinase [Pelagibacterium halotolerans]